MTRTWLMRRAYDRGLAAARRGWGRAGTRASACSVDGIAAFGNESVFQVLKLLLDKARRCLLGTDAPNPFVIPDFAIHEELANLVSAGFVPFQALRCGTSEAARFMDEADEWGTLAEGKRADLLLLSANPLMDVSAEGRPEVFGQSRFT